MATMTSISDIEKGIAAYLDSQLCDQYPDGSLQKAAFGACAAIAIRHLGNKIRKLQENQAAQFLEVFDADGNLDIDEVAESLKARIPESGAKYEHGTYSIGVTKDDIDKIRECIVK